MSVRRTREDPVVRRRLILEQATLIVGQRGYAGFTIQQLAERCGLTNGGLLYHFGSKEQLLVAILEDRDRRETAFVSNVFVEAAAAGSSRDAIVKMLRAIVARSVTYPEVARLHTMLRAEAMDPAHPAYDYFLRRETMILERFGGMVAAISTCPGSTARQILGLLEGLSQQWLFADRSFDLVAEWDEAIVRILPATSTSVARQCPMPSV